MRCVLLLAVTLLGTSAAFANDWQKFYTPAKSILPIEASPVPPEIVSSTGTADQDIAAMWRNGFGLIGYSSFNSANNKTADAVRWGTQLKARYIVMNTNLASSTSSVMPLTLPNTTTSTTTGTVTAGGSYGSYTANTTDYGTQTTYIPITINRFNKVGLYFGPIVHQGVGLLFRELTLQEVSQLETQKGFVVRAVRLDSPAYTANILPGDIVLMINGKAAEVSWWHAAMKNEGPLTMHLIRNGQPRDISVTIPADWKPSL